MKIIHVLHGLDPRFGGPSLMSVRLASEQAKAGHEVYIVGNFLPQRESEVLKVYSGMPGFDRLRLVNSGVTQLSEHLFPRIGFGHLLRLITRGAIVHLHGMWDPLLFLAFVIARRRGAAYVISPHSMLYPSQMRRYALVKKLLMKLGLRRMLRLAGFVHAINRAEELFLAEMDGSLKIRQIPNAIPEAIALSVDPSLFRLKHARVGNCRYILFLGRLHHQKGLLALGRAFVRIASHMPDVSLVVAGPDGGEKGAMEAMIKTAGLSSRVYFPGPLYGAEKISALRGADCYCQPSVHEGASMALLEALACGCPMVITEGCCFPEVEESEAGLIVPFSPQAIAQALEEVLRSQDLRNKMSSSGRQLMASRPDWPEIAARMVVAYNDCLKTSLFASATG